MKKLLFCAAVACGAFLVSCENKSAAADESWKDMNTKFYAAMEKNDQAALGSMIADNAVDHNANPMDGSDIVGKDSILAMFTNMNQCMKPGYKVNIVSQAKDGDMIYVLSDFKGTWAEGNKMGMPGGKDFDMRGVDVSKVKDGKFTDHWAFMSMKSMMEMMPPPAGTMPTMTTDTVMNPAK